MDIAKFLWGPTAPNPGWDHLTDRNQLVGFVEKLKRSSIGPDSQLAKVDGVCCSLRFLRVERRHPLRINGEGRQATCSKSCKGGQKWKLRKKR